MFSTNRTRRAGKRRAHGFSLLEMLVALSILAITLGLLYQGATGATRNIRTDVRYTKGVEIARSLLAANDRVPVIGVSEKGTTEDGFTWQVESASLGDDGVLATLHAIEVAVSWQDGSTAREVMLNSVVEAIAQ